MQHSFQSHATKANTCSYVNNISNSFRDAGAVENSCNAAFRKGQGSATTGPHAISNSYKDAGAVESPSNTAFRKGYGSATTGPHAITNSYRATDMLGQLKTLAMQPLEKATAVRLQVHIQSQEEMPGQFESPGNGSFMAVRHQVH